MRKHDHNNSPRPQRISRRDFIKLAAVAGLLAGCNPAQPPTATSTSEPTATSAPTVTPTKAPTATRTSVPTATRTPTVKVPRSELTKFYPNRPSKVVHARHAGVWDGGMLVPKAIRQMLDASITKLTGLDDADVAWAALFDPNEQIAIKVNTFYGSSFWTHVPLVMTVAERLQEVGVPPEQIVIFDRQTYELERAGYPINQDGLGVRCYGTENEYTTDWTVMDRKVGLSDILLSCDALINMPILKQHPIAGLTFAMKNHYGTFDRPRSFHAGIEHAIPELNALPPIRDRRRLIIGDALTVCPGGWGNATTWDSIFMSFDPVAHDTIGLQALSIVMTSEGRNPEAATNLANAWLTNSAELGLGTNDPDSIELVEANLG